MGESKSKVTSFFRQRGGLSVLLLAAIGAIVAVVFFWNSETTANDYITAKVDRGSVDVSVSATGTVQAVTTVQVGSQVSGTVQWLGADFNSQVQRGQVIARLDPAVFQAQVENARANVINAEAAVQGAEMEIVNQQANLTAAKANQEVVRVQRDDARDLVKRYQEISSVVASRDIQAAQANANAAAARYEQATAQVAQVQASLSTSRARVEQAKASLAQAKAQLQQSTVNLDHTIISSPIDGVVISRNVDVGQTVAASLQAPTLFTIANDLTKMQVLASIDEADVGQIKQGIKTHFSVDAFPGETFTGEISQLRLNAQTLQNVVTYSAVIDVANSELKLRPGMTTNITIPVARRDNVLTVPNAALRFRPTLSEAEQQALNQKMEERRNQRQAERGQGGQAADSSGQTAQPASEQPPNSQRGQGSPNASPGNQQPQSGAGQSGQGGQGGQSGQRRQGQTVWVLVGAKSIEPRFIRAGLTNGRVTEVLSGDLQEGDVIITGLNDVTNANRSASAPFGQQPQRGGRSR